MEFTGVSVGNPHCVIFRDRGEEWTRQELLDLGPELENHRLFPRRINVQLAVPVGPNSIYILIWERGAGDAGFGVPFLRGCQCGRAAGAG